MLAEMSRPRTIASRQHPLVARFRAAAAGEGDRLLLDGPHLVREAILAGLDLEVAAFETGRADPEMAGLQRDLPAGRVVFASPAVMRALSPARTPPGVVALAARPHPPALDALLARAGTLALGAIGVQDPGNAGAIVRAAEAGGATAVLTTADGADPFGWKALRGAMGSAFRLPLARVASADDVLALARGAGLQIVAAAGRGGAAPDAIDFRRPTAILLGAEGSGLPAGLLDAADARVTIPMAPPVESLNVAVTAALLVYEARRQRQARSAAAGLTAVR
jgi:TrmH family RNA methyltransferase